MRSGEELELERKTRMQEELIDFIHGLAWAKLLDPGSFPDHVADALTVLALDNERLADKLVQVPTPLLALAPDRMSMLAERAKFMPGGQRSYAPIAGELIAELRSLRLREDPWNLSALRREHGIVELLMVLDLAPQLDAADWEWIFDHHSEARCDFLGAFEKWCFAHDQVPEVLVRMITDLSHDGCELSDRYSVDRLAVLTSPSAGRMTKLAVTEDKRRSALDDEYIAVADAWERGDVPDAELETYVILDLCNPVISMTAGALRRVCDRHPVVALNALRAAAAEATAPRTRKILEVWLGWNG